MSFACSAGLFRGWVTQDCLAAKSRICDRRDFFKRARRFVQLAHAAGKVLRGRSLGDLSCGSKEQPASIWLAALHVLLEPERLFTWESGVGDVLATPRDQAVHQCSVVEDPVFSSVLAISVLTEDGGASLSERVALVRAQPPEGKNIVERTDEGWRITFAARSHEYPDRKGIRDIVELLQRPHQAVWAYELFGHPAQRNLRPSEETQRKATKAVSRRVASAKELAQERHAAFGRHLRFVSTGAQCCYAPPEDTDRWLVFR